MPRIEGTQCAQRCWSCCPVSERPKSFLSVTFLLFYSCCCCCRNCNTHTQANQLSSHVRWLQLLQRWLYFAHFLLGERERKRKWPRVALNTLFCHQRCWRARESTQNWSYSLYPPPVPLLSPSPSHFAVLQLNSTGRVESCCCCVWCILLLIHHCFAYLCSSFFLNPPPLLSLQADSQAMVVCCACECLILAILFALWRTLLLLPVWAGNSMHALSIALPDADAMCWWRHSQCAHHNQHWFWWPVFRRKKAVEQIESVSTCLHLLLLLPLLLQFQQHDRWLTLLVFLSEEELTLGDLWSALGTTTDVTTHASRSTVRGGGKVKVEEKLNGSIGSTVAMECECAAILSSVGNAAMASPLPPPLRPLSSSLILFRSVVRSPSHCCLDKSHFAL